MLINVIIIITDPISELLFKLNYPNTRSYSFTNIDISSTIYTWDQPDAGNEKKWGKNIQEYDNHINTVLQC